MTRKELEHLTKSKLIDQIEKMNDALCKIPAWIEEYAWMKKEVSSYGAIFHAERDFGQSGGSWFPVNGKDPSRTIVTSVGLNELRKLVDGATLKYVKTI
jgi:hypothetical protein